jgi:hypothetical protein
MSADFADYTAQQNRKQIDSEQPELGSSAKGATYDSQGQATKERCPW